MKQTIDDLKIAARTFAADCTDYMNVHSTSLKFSAERSIIFANDLGLGTLLETDDHAFSQVANRLDAPPLPWLKNPEHCPPQFAADILGNLAAMRPEMKLLIRAKGNTARAVLSTKYHPYDNVALIDAVAAAVETMGLPPMVARAEVGSDLSAYVLIPGITFAHDPRDRGGGGGIHPAVWIGNSEIGNRTVTIAGAVWSGICSNGMIYGLQTAETIFRMTHRVSAVTMAAFVNESLIEGFQMSEEAAHKFLASQEVKIELPSLKPLVNEWAARYGLTVSARENWLTAVPIEAMASGRATDDVRLFDVVNALTLGAHAEGRTVAERETMEMMGGELLSVMVPAAPSRIVEK